MAEQRAKLSNPFSTGGGGVNFEVYVQTYIAMHIVTGDSLPFLSSSKPVKMKLQGHYDGYNTDDCIVFGENGEKALCQIKHSITVSENDSVFRAVITDAWNDYCNSDTFNKKTDRIILIVSGLSKTDTDHTKVLFEWAEYCENEDEFTKKIATDGFSSKEKQKKYSAVKAQIESANEAGVSDYEIWDFFRHFNIQALELDDTKSPLFAAVSNSFSKAVGSSVSADTLYRYVAGYNQNAGTITREQLVQDLHVEEAGYSADDLTARENGNAVTHNWPKRFTTYIPVGPEVGLIGRNDIVDQVRTMLDSDKCVALVSGLGGIGKTAVMAEICNKIISEGRKDTYVAWITCGESYIDDLLTLWKSHGVPIELKREEAYDAIVRKLQELQGTLYLFLDDMARVPEKVELGMYNALRPNVRIMITSRHEIKGIPSLDLKELEKNPVVDMFYDYYGKDTERKYAADAWEIINSDSVRSHTLLVELLAKAANASFGSLADFRSKLEKEGFLKVSWRKFDTGRFDNKTIAESVAQLYGIASLSPEQQRIMSLFSIFTPEKEIYGAIEEWAGLDVDAIEGLVKLGWLVRVENGFVVHQIIVDSLIEQVGKGLKVENYGDLLNKVINVNSYLPRNLEYTKVQERLGFAKDVARNLEYRTEEMIMDSNSLEKNKRLLISSSNLFHNIGYVCFNQTNYDEAIYYYKKAICYRTHVLGQNHPLVATSYNNIAGVYEKQCDYDNALKYYSKGLSIRMNNLGPEHIQVSTSYNNLAGVYEDLDDYGLAMEYYEKALKIQERLCPNQRVIATTYNNIGALKYKLDKTKEALVYFEKALVINESLLTPNHPVLAQSYNNIAMILSKEGKNEKALEYLEKALVINENVLGPEHVDTATTYCNLASVCEKLNDYLRARVFYEKAISVQEKILGTAHPSTASTYNNVALMYLDKGELVKALGYSEKACKSFEKALGIEHISTAIAYQNLAKVLYLKGDYEKALDYYQKSLAIFKVKFEDSHPYIRDTIESIEIVKTCL